MTPHALRRATEIGASVWKRLRRLVRRGTPRAAVLMYHRVAEAEVDPWELCVSPTHFAEHVECLRERGIVWSLSSYAERLRRGVPPRRAIILTFDDGYVDNWTTALPLLDAQDLPATFFIPTGRLGSNRSFWWDTLADCLLHEHPLPERIALDDPTAPHEPIQVTGRSADDSEGRRELYRELWTLLSQRAPENRRALLDQLCAATHTPTDAPESRRVMTPDEVADLSRHPDMELGSHTVSHTPLPVLSPEEQREELQQSQEVLQGLAEGPVSGLSYPNGAYDATTQALAQDLGFTHACTTVWDAVTWTTDPVALPRLHVRDVDGDTLDEWLSQLLD